MDGISDAGSGQPMGGAPESAPVATSMSDIYREFSQPEPTPAPVEQPVEQQQFYQPPVEQQPVEQVAAEEGTDDAEENWFEKLLGQAELADPIASLLDEQAFAQATQSPESLRGYAEQVREALKTQSEQAKAVAEIDQAAQWVGGRDRAKIAFDLTGDLFRGDLPIDEADALPEFQAETYVDRFLNRVEQVHPDTYEALAVSVLNNAKGVIQANAGYLLKQLGIDPRYIEDYKRVAAVGGFEPPEDVAAEANWLKENIPAELHDVFRKLDPDVKADMRARPAALAKRSLEQEAFFQRQESEKQQREQRESFQKSQEAEVKASETLVKETWGVIEEYVKKGTAFGLNPLEAAGAAMLAYQKLDQQYWANGEARRAIDGLHQRIKTGNELQISGGRKAYQKLFETAYREALSSYKPQRKTAPGPAQPATRQIAPPTAQRPAQFIPQAPPEARPAATRIEDIIKEFEHLRPR